MRANRIVPMHSISQLYLHRLEQSCLFDDDVNTFMLRSQAAVDNAYAFCLSFWAKRNTLGIQTSPIGGYNSAGGGFWHTGWVAFDSNDKLRLADFIYGTGYYTHLISTAVFRDVASWYHIFIHYDSTPASPGANDVYMCVNGVKITSLDTAIYPSQNTRARLNVDTNTPSHIFGKRSNTAGAGTDAFDGAICEVHLCDVAGGTYSVNDFGEYKKGIWIPKKFEGSHGNNGWYLDFANAGNLGADASGGGNNFTSYSMTTTMQVLDTPTENHCNLAINMQRQSSQPVFRDGGLWAYAISAGDWVAAFGSFAVDSGVWYWEVTPTIAVNVMIGIALYNDITAIFQNYPGYTTYSCGYLNNGQKYIANTPSAYGASYTSGDVIGVLLDMNAGTVTFYKNNVSQGVAMSGLTGAYLPSIAVYFTNDTVKLDFGQRGFVYTPPSGAKALKSSSLNIPVIIDGKTYMDILTYTGNGSDPRAFTDLDFQPDLVWIKDRSVARSHHLYDAVRGATNYLISNDVNVEATAANGLESFDANGFTLGDHANVNANTENYVAWCFREMAKCGFDILTYTGDGINGRTLSHSLGVVPEIIIIKSRSDGYNWVVWTKDLSGYDYSLRLNLTNAQSNAIDALNSTAPTTSIVTLSNTASVNENTKTYLMYLFRSVVGFSKVFSYVGDGTTSGGPMVPLGFRPRFIIIKNRGAAAEWVMIDTERDFFNPNTAILSAESTTLESSYGFVNRQIDVLSNGFKIAANAAGGTTALNASGNIYVGIAFADQPLKYANAK